MKPRWSRESEQRRWSHGDARNEISPEARRRGRTGRVRGVVEVGPVANDPFLRSHDGRHSRGRGGYPAAYRLSLIHISEPTRQAEISYAVFCLKKKKKKTLR